MPYKYHDLRRHHIKKQPTFRRDWSQYSESLKDRGDMTIWLSHDVIDQWYEKDRVYDGTGTPNLYSDMAILTVHEIHQVFKLVKNAAHFSNISYLLSFDETVVANVLAQRYPENPIIGGSFIDKIIQLPVFVPSVDQSLLNQYLIDELNKIIKQSKWNISQDDMSRFQAAYFSRDLDELFDTPRKVVRYLNTIDFSVERLKGETSFTDIALIDLLRNFYPKLYKRVAANRAIILAQGLHGQRT